MNLLCPTKAFKAIVALFFSINKYNFIYVYINIALHLFYILMNTFNDLYIYVYINTTFMYMYLEAKHYFNFVQNLIKTREL